MSLITAEGLKREDFLRSFPTQTIPFSKRSNILFCSSALICRELLCKTMVRALSQDVWEMATFSCFFSLNRFPNILPKGLDVLADCWFPDNWETWIWPDIESDLQIPLNRTHRCHGKRDPMNINILDRQQNQAKQIQLIQHLLMMKTYLFLTPPLHNKKSGHPVMSGEGTVQSGF